MTENEALAPNGQRTLTEPSHTDGYRWTWKRKIALEYLIETLGDVSAAAQLTRLGKVAASTIGRLLRDDDENAPFINELNRRIAEVMAREGVDKAFVIRGLVGLATPGSAQEGVQLGALRSLGDHLGMFQPEAQMIDITLKVYGFDPAAYQEKEAGELSQRTIEGEGRVVGDEDRDSD